MVPGRSTADITVAMTTDPTVPPRMTPYGAKWEAPTSVRKRLAMHAQHGFRLFGAATAPLRADPDYLLIGTKRGGTTSLARWLLDHPDVRGLYPAAERRKGAYFFDINYHRGHGWYRSHFPVRAIHEFRGRRRRRHQLIGDATPYYLHHPHAADRAGRHVPNAKIIVLVRHPVDRAVGHWAERTRNGVETLDFGEALRAEAARLTGEEQRMIDDPTYVSFAHQHFSYVDQGRYARGLKRWRHAFPPEQILVLRSEDLYADPATVYRQVLDFLELEAHEPAEFEAWNSKPKETISDEDRRFIEAALGPDVAELEAMLGRTMDWQGFES